MEPFDSDSKDLLDMANEAKEAKYLSGYVDWLTVALEKAVLEKKSRKYIERIKYVLKKPLKYLNDFFTVKSFQKSN